MRRLVDHADTARTALLNAVLKSEVLHRHRWCGVVGEGSRRGGLVRILAGE